MPNLNLKKAAILALGVVLLFIAYVLLIGYTNYCYDQGYRDAVRDLKEVTAE